MFPRAACVSAIVLASIGCGSTSAQPGSGDAGDGLDASLGVRDASRPTALVDAAEAVDAAQVPYERMTKHDGVVLPSLRVVAVYFGEADKEGGPSFDGFMTWLLASDYWGHLKQYGVGTGSLVGSIRLDASAIFTPGTAPVATMTTDELGWRIDALLHPAPSDGGVEAGVDASTIPRGDAYVFFLPEGLGITTPAPDGHGVWTTCDQFGGYHGFDAKEPFAVIPGCSLGRNGQTISHELAEMATDPSPPRGWSSDVDDDTPGGGEVGDLCNFPVTTEGWSVTALWSNADGRCVPSP